MSDEPEQTPAESEVSLQNEPTDQENAVKITTEKVENSSNNENGESVSKEAAGGNAEYEKYITYSEEGTAIYTDPATNIQYIFDTDKNQWVPKDGESPEANASVYDTEHYRWCTETNKWIVKDGVSDPGENPYENEHYIWNPVLSKWEPKIAVDRFATSVFEDGQHLYTDPDGVVYFWDEEKKAWFPKIDDDFMAIYQTNYGFIDNTTPATPAPQPTPQDEATEADVNQDEAQKTAKRKANQPQWFEEEPEKCTKVYVSDLPDDITEEEFVEVMSKCGMIFRDPKTKKMKVKLYAEKNGQLKGDGLVHYIRVESVQLALDMLDGYEVKGRKIKVQRAQFQMRGEYNPALKPKRRKQDKEKQKKMQEKLLDWRPDKMRGEREKHERTVIIKNLFEPQIFDNHVDLIIDYQNKVREECAKVGNVKKVIIYSCEPEGICEVRMSDPEEADLVIQMMDRRFFGKRLLSAQTWDGKTKYKLNETEDERNERLAEWEKFLEQGDDSEKSDDAPTFEPRAVATAATAATTAETEME